MKRKRFLFLSTAGAIALALPSWNACRGPVKYPETLKELGDISKIWDAKQIKLIGKAYLSKNPSQKNQRSLVTSLLTDAPSDSTAIPNFIDDRIVQDYRTGKTVMVKGWILSETEAQKYALLSME